MWKSLKNRTFSCFLPLKYWEKESFLVSLKQKNNEYYKCFTPFSKT